MNYYIEIKEQLINNEITKRVKDYSKNKSDLNTYYEVGKLLSEAGKHYGEGIIKEYSKKLSTELNKQYSCTTLKYYRLFYNFSKRHPVGDELSFSHYRVLFTIKDERKINYYMNQAIKRNLSKRELEKIVKNNEYERLPIETRNKIDKKDDNKVTDLIKNPIFINNKYNYEIISEKVLQRLILEDMNNFLKE